MTEAVQREMLPRELRAPVICADCGESFQPRSTGRLPKRCVTCRHKRDIFLKRESLQRSRADGPRECDVAYNKKSNLRYHYGISEEQYDELLAAQGGVCVLCKEPPGSKRLSVDHDHSCCPGRKSCGKCIRGLLHSQCNIAVAYHELIQNNEVMRKNIDGYLRGGR